MKKLVLLTCLMLIVTNAMAYKAMVVEGYSWNVVTSYWQIFPDITTYNTRKQRIEGDSIINGSTYTKLWEHIDANSENCYLLTLLREDINEQKVFAYNDGAEVLLYDLGVEIGDTIRVWNYLPSLKDYDSTNIEYGPFSYLVVDTIEPIQDQTYSTLKKIKYHKAEKDSFTATIFERYGSTTGWAYNHYAERIGEANHDVICAFDENDELVLKREYTITGYGNIEDCYIKEEIGTNIKTLQKEENIYYNSKEKTLYIDVENIETITIYDAMGKMIINQAIATGIKQFPLNLNSGIYIVHFSINNQQVIRTKIVVK